MKTSTKLLATLSNTELKNLTTTVSETLATTNNCNKKSFTALDLWSIQKQRRSFSVRRF